MEVERERRVGAGFPFFVSSAGNYVKREIMFVDRGWNAVYVVDGVGVQLQGEPVINENDPMTFEEGLLKWRY